MEYAKEQEKMLSYRIVTWDKIWANESFSSVVRCVKEGM